MNATDAAQAAWESQDKSHLSETLTALNRLPEVLRGTIRDHLDALVAHDFVLSVEKHLELGEPMGPRDISRLLNSAKLGAMSYASYLGFMPWHLAERSPELMGKMTRLFEDGLNCEGVHEAIRSSGAINLFVAARDSDDRSSYLRSVKALIERLPVATLVLDEEMVYHYGANMSEACAAIGMHQGHVTVATRSNVVHLSDMSIRGIKGVFLNTEGRQFNPRADRASANDANQPPAIAAPAATAPPASTSDRLATIRARQAAARKAA
ncbi:hypothetical protein [Hydrogenophaga sp. 2FB]|uniref:hypothetical protein n=1 Tax=Hydrogenophaga sp. 2FB TaxID=2502187 RepID=UPI0010F78C12|nr:hypothetical protein [Hydrogenophaga sp. 2FB]